MSSHITCNWDLAFDVKDGNISNCGNIILNQKHGGMSQKFSLTHRGNDYHSIDLVGTDFVLDIKENRIEAGTNVILYKYHGGDNQLWMLEPWQDAAYTFSSKADSNMVLDVDRSPNPNNLIIWKSHGGENQRFKLSGERFK